MFDSEETGVLPAARRAGVCLHLTALPGKYGIGELGEEAHAFVNALGRMHEHAGFLAFQELVSCLSFRPDYYELNREKLLGPDGVWGQLNGKLQAHLRFIEACNGHDVRDRLGEIKCPTLVIHAGQDVITGPRTTLPLEQGLPNATGVLMEDVAHVVAGKAEKIAFCEILFPFLAAN